MSTLSKVDAGKFLRQLADEGLRSFGITTAMGKAEQCVAEMAFRVQLTMKRCGVVMPVEILVRDPLRPFENFDARALETDFKALLKHADETLPKPDPAVTDWQQRVRDEKAELDERTTKLLAFMDTDPYGKLEMHDQLLLREQLRHMQWLSDILGQRIARFKP